MRVVFLLLFVPRCTTLTRYLSDSLRSCYHRGSFSSQEALLVDMRIQMEETKNLRQVRWVVAASLFFASEVIQ